MLGVPVGGHPGLPSPAVVMQTNKQTGCIAWSGCVTGGPAPHLIARQGPFILVQELCERLAYNGIATNM